MAILTTAQKKKLDTLAQGKAFYEAEVAKIKQELEIRRGENKAVVISLINECVAAGIPIRQIHMIGMGMAQANQMTNFMTTKTGTQRERLLAMVDPSHRQVEIEAAKAVEAEPEKKEPRVFVFPERRLRFPELSENINE